MSNPISRLQFVGVCAVLSLFVLGSGCSGFFVDPTVTGVQVGPTASIQQTKTIQMTATKTFDDGSTKVTSSGVAWSSSSASVATVNSAGLVTGVGPGQTTITGAVGSFSGTATITVTLTGITSITITPANTSITGGNSQQFMALANGGSQDIASSVTWSLNPAVTGASFDTNGNLTTQSVATAVTVQVVAKDPTSGVQGTTNLTINP